MQEELRSMLFPHSAVRETQLELMRMVKKAAEHGGHIIVHAPTGLGKTASTLPVALSAALSKDLTVFFLTSRNTQHLIAIETLRQVKEKYHVEFITADMVGKKLMCAQPDINDLTSNEFSYYCKLLREEDQCDFYSKSKSAAAKHELERLLHTMPNPSHSELVVRTASSQGFCPYETALTLAKKAKVIVGDYNYIFNPSIQGSFFKKAGLQLERSIVIVDEAHNLPARLQSLMTFQLSTFVLRKGAQEARKYGNAGLQSILENILEKLEALAELQETLVEKRRIIELVDGVIPYEELTAELTELAEHVREQQRQSSLGSIAEFLDAWTGADKGYARILSRQERGVKLSYRCMDPGLLTSSLFRQMHSCILMSGTLTPTEMYADLLGLPKTAVQLTYASAFPQENRLAIIIPETTTKFIARTPEMYERTAEICTDIVNMVPGNSAVFFPSYMLRDEVYVNMAPLCKKRLFMEQPGMSKEEKFELLEEFKQHKEHGAALLGVASASFAEGIDLPGDMLKCVVIVGLPLQKPDLETQELIKYYDIKFGHGWNYGYIYPAFNKCLQSAGRCIRSETDRGVIVFLDERYIWQNYYRCFPKDMGVKIMKQYAPPIVNFFAELQK